jgi:hypothetical protein
MVTMNLRECLQQYANGWEKMGHPRFATMERFVLKHGVEGRARKPGRRKGKLKECFKNSTVAAFKGGLRYVEGYALKPGLIPVHHAWNLDEEGRVIDLTWRDNLAAEYLGIEIDTVTLTRTACRTGYFGMFAPGDMVNIEFLKQLDPELFATLWKEAA